MEVKQLNNAVELSGIDLNNKEDTNNLGQHCATD